MGEGKKDARWTTPFATRLDVDTLEDLVEGAGGFITDRHVSHRNRMFQSVALLLCVYRKNSPTPISSSARRSRQNTKKSSRGAKISVLEFQALVCAQTDGEGFSVCVSLVLWTWYVSYCVYWRFGLSRCVSRLKLAVTVVPETIAALRTVLCTTQAQRNGTSTICTHRANHLQIIPTR